MEIADWLMILAVLSAPIFAIQVQRFLELIRERRRRKLDVFHTLMATRAMRLAPRHVEALNLIDIEFYGSRFLGIPYRSREDQAVIEAWRVYHDCLNSTLADSDPKPWASRRDELFTDVLYAMSRALGYSFDKVQLQRGIYFPKGHGEQELYGLTMQQYLREIMEGKRKIPVHILSSSTLAAIGDNRPSARLTASGDGATGLEHSSLSPGAPDNP